MRNVLGQVRRKIDFRFMMDTGRLYIADLSKSRLDRGSLNRNGGGLRIFQTERCANGQGDSKNQACNATPALGPISTTEVTQRSPESFPELNPRSVVRRLS